MGYGATTLLLEISQRSGTTFRLYGINAFVLLAEVERPSPRWMNGQTGGADGFSAH